MAQEKSIQFKLVDSKTKKALPYATVFLKNQGIGSSTNLNGETGISIKNTRTTTDTLICLYIGYENKKIPVDFNEKTPVLVLMDLEPSELQPIEVVYEKPLSAKQILKKVIKYTEKKLRLRHKIFKWIL